MNPTSQHRPRRLHVLFVALTLLTGAFAPMAVGTPTASAARSIQPSPGFFCDGALVRVRPPRVYADRTEQVLWAIAIERYNGRHYVPYDTTYYWASFNYYGFNVTGWSVHNNTGGGRFVGSTMNTQVRHRGYYRVGSVVQGGGLRTAEWIGGPNNYCYVP